MQGWSLAELKAAADDPKSPAAKVAAANQWMRGILEGSELDRILDRTDGKPAQSVDVTSKGESLVQLVDRPSWEKV